MISQDILKHSDLKHTEKTGEEGTWEKYSLIHQDSFFLFFFSGTSPTFKKISISKTESKTFSLVNYILKQIHHHILTVRVLLDYWIIVSQKFLILSYWLITLHGTTTCIYIYIQNGRRRFPSLIHLTETLWHHLWRLIGTIQLFHPFITYLSVPIIYRALVGLKVDLEICKTQTSSSRSSDIFLGTTRYV